MNQRITRSVGARGANQSNDVRIVQQLLNDNIGKLIPLRPLVVDGLNGRNTEAAIREFQKRVVGMRMADGRVDPNGQTLAELNKGSRPGSRPPVAQPRAGTITLTIAHGNQKPPSSGSTDNLYESTVTLSGGLAGTFRGSIYPDDMSVKGRIKDGQYDLHIGFHKRQGLIPSNADLVAKLGSEKLRPALIVNLDNSVPVISDNPGKTTSSAIHVHNGFRSKRYSHGCPTIHPDDWAKFIRLFLNKYKTLAEWQSTNRYVGAKIGKLVVKA